MMGALFYSFLNIDLVSSMFMDFGPNISSFSAFALKVKATLPVTLFLS